VDLRKGGTRGEKTGTKKKTRTSLVFAFTFTPGASPSASAYGSNSPGNPISSSAPATIAPPISPSCRQSGLDTSDGMLKEEKQSSKSGRRRPRIGFAG
jgi:hypothetical protein